jgi:hypothetical protein
MQEFLLNTGTISLRVLSSQLTVSPLHLLTFIRLITLFFQKNPYYSFFKVFGCKCYPYIRPYTAHKLAPRSTPYVYLGYSHTYKEYKCLDLHTNKIYISRHVIFDENSFPFKIQSLSSAPLSSASSSSSLLVILQPSSSELNPTPPPHSDTSPPQSSLSISTLLSITKIYTRRCSHKNTSLSSHSPTPTSVHAMQTRSKSKALAKPPNALLSSQYPLDNIDLEPTTFN